MIRLQSYHQTDVKPVDKGETSPLQKTFHLSAPKIKKKKNTEKRLNDVSRTAACSFYDTFDGSVLKSRSCMVILKNTNISYLPHRHAAHTGVQHARPCIGAHFTDEREPLLPVDTVEMDWLPSEGNKQTFIQVGADF